MRVYHLLPLAAISTAFVIPDQELFASEEQSVSSAEAFERQPIIDKAWEFTDEYVIKSWDCAKNTWDGVVSYGEDVVNTKAHTLWEGFSAATRRQFHDGDVDLFDRPHHRPHGPGKPHKPPHHGKPNRTVYELISESKYTTKLAELIGKDEELVKLLNSTTANFTVFAPIDSAFEKIPKHHKEVSDEFIKKLLTYHVSTDFYPAGRVLTSRTIPTALTGEYLGGELQRLSTQISLKGLTVNFYARIVAIDIFGTNGVIHGLDSILVPPPKVVDIISFLPGEFSTLELALLKTGLLPAFNDTSTHIGGTLFAPSNFAFQLLGPRINAFLFSKYGEKYLRALLKYHVTPNNTLYSDAFYPASEAEAAGHDSRIPMDRFHVDLPTALGTRSLGVDVIRYGRLIEIRINGFNRVAVPDGIAADGVIHVLSSVLIPPRTPGGPGVSGEGMALEEFKERLEPFVEAGDGDEDKKRGFGEL